MTEENQDNTEQTDEPPSESAEIDAATLAYLENLVKHFCTTIKLLKLYPVNNPIPGQALDRLFSLLEDYLDKEGELRIDILKDGVLIGSKPISEGNETIASFAADLYNRNLSSVTFFIGLTKTEVANFLMVTGLDADVIKSQGGLDTLLWEKEVSNISVEEMVRKIIDVGGEGKTILPSAEGVAESAADIERIKRSLETASPTRQTEWKVLTRMISQPQEVTRYIAGLNQTRPAKGSEADLIEKIDQLNWSLEKLGNVINQEEPSVQPALYRNIVEAVLSLDEKTRLKLLGEKILPKALRDPLAINLISQLSPDELATNIGQIISKDSSKTEEIADILKNINLSGQTRNEVLELLSKELGESGQAFARLVTAKTEPIKVETQPETIEETKPKRFDKHVSEFTDDIVSFSPEEFEAITQTGLAISEHSAAMTTVNTLLDLLAQEERLVQFSQIIALLEDISASLLDHHEFSLAVRVVKTLKEQVAIKSDYTPKYRERLDNSMKDLGSPQNIKKLVHALHDFKKESEEVKNIHSYLTLLDRKVVIASLLEILSTEKEMSRRKLVSSIITAIGRYDISVLGRKISDPRWFFVRNIVEILGLIGNEEAIPYLDVTLKHTDRRVRKETIGSLGLIGGQKSLELLLSSLEDKDTSIRQMAAKWIGSTRNPQAIAPLSRIVQKRDLLNRNYVLKKYAIESLGLIGSNEALPVLNKVISKKPLFNKAKYQEIRESAIEALRQIGTAEAREVLEKLIEQPRTA